METFNSKKDYIDKVVFSQHDISASDQVTLIWIDQLINHITAYIDNFLGIKKHNQGPKMPYVQ